MASLAEKRLSRLHTRFLDAAHQFPYLFFAAAKPLSEPDGLPIGQRWPFFFDSDRYRHGLPKRYWEHLLGKPTGAYFCPFSSCWLQIDGCLWEGAFFDGQSNIGLTQEELQARNERFHTAVLDHVELLGIEAAQNLPSYNHPHPQLEHPLEAKPSDRWLEYVCSFVEPVEREAFLLRLLPSNIFTASARAIEVLNASGTKSAPDQETLLSADTLVSANDTIVATFGELLQYVQGCEEAYKENLAFAEQHRDSFAYLAYRSQADALRFHADPVQWPGIDCLEALCQAEFGTGLTAENLGKLRGRLYANTRRGPAELDALTVQEVVDSLHRKFTTDAERGEGNNGAETDETRPQEPQSLAEIADVARLLYTFYAQNAGEYRRAKEGLEFCRNAQPPNAFPAKGTMLYDAMHDYKTQSDQCRVMAMTVFKLGDAVAKHLPKLWPSLRLVGAGTRWHEDEEFNWDTAIGELRQIEAAALNATLAPPAAKTEQEEGSGGGDMADPDLQRRFMEMAVKEAYESTPEDHHIHPRVGAVVVKNGSVLATAHRGELGKGDHAEFTALEKKLERATVAGATVYTTLEPCTTRNHPKWPCANWLIARKVKRVVIGMLDPNEKICGKGVLKLREANIIVEFFPHNLMSEIEEMNREFIRHHKNAAERSPTSGESEQGKNDGGIGSPQSPNDSSRYA